MEDRLTIKFELKTQKGYQPTKSISTQPPNKGSNVQPAKNDNTFLIQCGYPRRDNIFMESLTDDELEAVAYFLEDYRLAKKNKEKNNEED